MILIAVLHLMRKHKDLAENSLLCAFLGAKPFRPCQAPQFPHSLHAGRAPQPVFRHSAHPSPWLTCPCICYPLFTYIMPALQCQPRISKGSAAQPLTLVHFGESTPVGGGTLSPHAGHREPGRTLDPCGTAQCSTMCHGSCLSQNICKAVIYFTLCD